MVGSESPYRGFRVTHLSFEAQITHIKKGFTQNPIAP